MLPGSPLQAEIALVNRDVPLSNVRDYASRSANFALPDEWTSSNPSGIDLMAVLEDRVDECPDCGGNNRTTERGLVFVAQPELHIVPVRIRATRGITRAISSEDASDTLFTKLMKLYPVNEENVIVHSEDDRVLRTEANLGTNDGLGELLDEIADRFVCYQDDFWACGWREGHYFGVISTTVQMGPASPDDPLGRWSGMARRNDCVALGREGRTNTAAHEIGHNLGRMHASNDHGEDDGGDWEEWPYPHGGIGTVGFDTSADRARRLARADAVHWHDLMSYGSGLGSWISPHTYLALHQNLDFCAGFPPGSVAQGAQRSSAQPPTPQHYWLVTGQLDPPELRTVQRVSARLVPAEEPGSSPYAIELQDESGAPLTHRAFEPVHEHVGQAESTHRFRQYLPDTPGVVRVVLFEGQSELASRNASTHAPEVTVTMPDASARWPAAGTARVRWVADDADGDELTYIVMYSRDGGALWVNLATGVRTTEYDVDLGDLGGSDGRAVVRVQATDGFNSGFGESAAFTVVGKGPKARIVLPEPGDLPIPEGYPLRLLAQAYDREDGQLAGRRLAWMSGSASEGGRLLGTGRSLVLDNLPAGRHVVRLRVTDANRGVAEDTRVVYVGHVVWMPAVSRGDVRP
jgi:hypothetical protein